MIAAEDLRNQVQALKSVLCPQGSGSPGLRNCTAAGIDAMENTLTATESVAWRMGAAGTDGADALSSGVAGAVRALREGIRVVASRSVSLTSKHGKVPVTLENNTTFTVNVVLSLASTDHSRLRSATRVVLIVPALQKEQIEVDVDAEGAGTFPVDIQILTPAGRPLSAGPPLRILVKSTVFGVIAVAITGGSLAVLVFAVAIRLVRRLRALRRQPPADPLPPQGADIHDLPDNPDLPDSPDTLECARRTVAEPASRDPRAEEHRADARRAGEYRRDGLERLVRATNAVRNTERAGCPEGVRNEKAAGHRETGSQGTGGQGTTRGQGARR